MLIHATTRKRRLVNKFESDGLLISYNRVEEIQINVTRLYIHDKKDPSEGAPDCLNSLSISINVKHIHTFLPFIQKIFQIHSKKLMLMFFYQF